MRAADILQAYVNEAASAVLSDDWDTYRDGISLPCAMISRDTSVIVAKEADLRAGFDAFRAMLKGQNVTDYVKLVEHAHFLDKDLISGYYLSHILSNGRTVIPPFRCLLDLRLEGKRWRACALTDGLRHDQWPGMQPDTRDTGRVAEETDNDAMS
jgi:hypothetical protein